MHTAAESNLNKKKKSNLNKSNVNVLFHRCNPSPVVVFVLMAKHKIFDTKTARALECENTFKSTSSHKFTADGSKRRRNTGLKGSKVDETAEKFLKKKKIIFKLLPQQTRSADVHFRFSLVGCGTYRRCWGSCCSPSLRAWWRGHCTWNLQTHNSGVRLTHLTGQLESECGAGVIWSARDAGSFNTPVFVWQTRCRL